ncbi:hypothetical protein [Aquabacterium sp.]|uniref:hypothetical protein n=1 Tax=Aquabacterium sp. TaxID=1872578 RepID=UPI003BF4A680
MAGTWLLILSVLNLSLDGALRNVILYAVPVALVAWYDSNAGFIFSALGAICAWLGGAIPSPHVDESVVMEGMWAFAKLSAVVCGVNWGKARSLPCNSVGDKQPERQGTKR